MKIIYKHYHTPEYVTKYGIKVEEKNIYTALHNSKYGYDGNVKYLTKEEYTWLVEKNI
jgi:hypothetical protein